MSVYVDNAYARLGKLVMCHLIADSEAELHEMAKRVGLYRKWFQGDHYDIGLTKRAQAVRYGAIEITTRQCAAMRANRRDTGNLGTPETAIEIWRDRRAA